MRAGRYLLAFVLLLGFSANVAAQVPGNETKLIITPREARLDPGQGLQFQALLFGANGQPIRIEQISWVVLPDSLGKISDDGFFMAGRKEGEVKIIAKAQAGKASYAGEAHVIIGREPAPRVKIVVDPGEAVVPPLGTQQFKAIIVVPNEPPEPAERVKWEFVPNQLAKISPTGLLQAGQATGVGTAVAWVELNGAVFRGEARVVIAPAPSASIAGAVKNQKSGEPIVNAVVLAELVGRPFHWSRRILTDDAGNYIIEKLIPGLYVLRADSRGYLPEFYKEAEHSVNATLVQLAENENKTAIDFTLSKGATISGLVATASDSTPITGAQVVAIRILTPEVKHHAITNSNGNYSLIGLPTGSYAIFVEAGGFRSEFYKDKEPRDILKADPVFVQDEQVVEGIDMYLGTASAITGKVVDAVSKQTIAKVAVTIYALINSNRPRPIMRVSTDEAGEYIANVPPGSYVVSAEAAGYIKEFYLEEREFLKAKPVQVFEDKHTTGIDFTMDALAMITGRVTDQATSEPIAGAIVTAFPEKTVTGNLIDPDDLRRPLVAKTDALGNYKITEVRAGKYFVLAEGRGYLREYWQESAILDTAKLVEAPEHGSVDGINFTLEQGGAISGVVLAAADNRPLGFAFVQVTPKDRNAVMARGITERDGKYRLNGLRAGDYLVFASAPGFNGLYYKDVEARANATPVHVEAPKATEGIDFHLTKIDQPPRGGVIAGNVISEADKNPIPQAFVLAIPLSTPIPVVPPFAVADQFGSYKIPVPAGRYVVVSWASGYIAEFFENADSFQKAKILGIENNVIDNINFTLKPAPRGLYHIAGRVRHKNQNRGAENVVVQAIEDGVVVGSTITDADGDFILEEMPAGEFKLAAAGVAGSAESGTVTVGNGRNASNVELVLSPTSVEETSTALPTSFELEQNYPNPFNPETSIKYHLPVRTNVSLRIYNALGQEIRTLVNMVQDGGVYSAKWDGKDNNGRQLSTGIYLFRLEAGDFVMTRKMAMVR